MNYRFIAATALAIAGCGRVAPPAPPASAAPAPAQAEDFHLIEGTFNTAIGPDGNTVIFDAPGGLVVIDAGRHKTHSQKILDYAAQRGAPITTIINTHWHLDHATGNQDLKAAYPGAKLYTTRAVEGALDGFLAAGLPRTEARLRDPNLDPVVRTRLERGYNTIKGRVTLLPDVPVERTMKLPVNGRDLELHVTDHAVTESDVWIWDPATKTVIAGDIVTLPVPLFDTGCAAGWLAAFDAIETKPYERVIPGHGFPMNRAEFAMYRDAFRKLVRCAGSQNGAACAQAWVADVSALLDKQPTRDFADKAYAREGGQYYVDEILRSDAKRAEFCAK